MGAWFKVKKDFDNVDRLYILEIMIGDTLVYKVGKASGHSCKQRMLQIIGSYFDVYRVTPIIKVVKDKEVSNVFEKETKCHHALAEWQYIPEKAFSGSTELFLVDKEKVLEVYKDVLQSTEE
jgi:hypothetical protein